MAQDRAEGPACRVDGSPAAEGRRSRGSLVAALLGLGLIGLWVGLFIASVRQDRLVFGRSTWIIIPHCMGVDFKLAIDHVARVEALGFKPYQVLWDKYCAQYPYPPMLGRFFRWVTYFDKRTASVLWQSSLGWFAAVGCLAAWRTRKRLGLDSIPLPLMVAAVLFCTPFVFAVERGQCDPMIIPPLVVAAWLLGRRGTWADFAAGGLLGLTAWIKYYPGLAVIALVTLGRRKALATFLGVVALVGIIDLEGIRESFKAGKLIESRVLVRVGSVHESSHSLIEAWNLNGSVRESPFLRGVPAALPAAILLVPALVWVSRRIARAKDQKSLIYPYLLWLVSVGTFALPYSNDYNLTPLPLAMLAVWDRRDRAAIQLVLAFSVLWLQPFWLPIGGGLLLFLKLGALHAVGASLAARASHEGDRSDPEAQENLFRPIFARVKRPRTVDGGIEPGSGRPQAGLRS